MFSSACQLLFMWNRNHICCVNYRVHKYLPSGERFLTIDRLTLRTPPFSVFCLNFSYWVTPQGFFIWRWSSEKFRIDKWINVPKRTFCLPKFSLPTSSSQFSKVSRTEETRGKLLWEFVVSLFEIRVQIVRHPATEKFPNYQSFSASFSVKRPVNLVRKLSFNMFSIYAYINSCLSISYVFICL